MIEYTCVGYLSKDDKEIERYEDFNIPIPEESQMEKIVLYSFKPYEIIEVRETFVTYEDEWQPAVAITYSSKDGNVFYTPALLVSYTEFKKRLNEYYKEDVKTE